MFVKFMCWDNFTEHFHYFGPTGSTAPCGSAVYFGVCGKGGMALPRRAAAIILGETLLRT
jgi:hypothetical protein